MRRYLIPFILIVLIMMPVWGWAGPGGLSDDEMENIYAKGIAVDGVNSEGMTGSAMATDSSSSMADTIDSAVQIGVDGSETGQNQLDTAGSEVAGGNSAVVNLDGDNREQNNLTKAVQASGSAQSGNNGIIANCAQGVFLQPLNIVTATGSTLRSDISQHSTTTVMMTNY